MCDECFVDITLLKFLYCSEEMMACPTQRIPLVDRDNMLVDLRSELRPAYVSKYGSSQKILI